MKKRPRSPLCVLSGPPAALTGILIYFFGLLGGTGPQVNGMLGSGVWVNEAFGQLGGSHLVLTVGSTHRCLLFQPSFSCNTRLLTCCRANLHTVSHSVAAARNLSQSVCGDTLGR